MRFSSDAIETGEPARLIPVIADSRREQRVASVFLAILSAIPGLAQVLLSGVGVRLGKRSVIDTYTEIVLKCVQGSKDRPDGLVVVSSGNKSWTALIEAKIGNASLDSEQVQRYLQLAKTAGIDAVITISNQFVARPTHSPIRVPKGLTKKIGLFHWSWKMILTEAVLLQTRGEIQDPDQAFLLREFVRFVSHDSIGITGFDSMPPEWRAAISLVKVGGIVSRSSDEAQAIVTAWHQETRDLALRMSRHLATNVELRLSRAHANDADLRLLDDCATLSSDKQLKASYSIPNAASNLSVTADLMTQTIRVGMEVGAPQDKQRGSARVNWLLRQLKNTDDEQIFVRVVWPTKAQDTVCRLSELRDDAQSIVGSASQPPRSFEVFRLSDDGRKFSGRKTFIEELEKSVPEFYDKIGQNLSRWIPKPPKPVVGDEVRKSDETFEEKEEKSISAPEKPRISPGNSHAELIGLPDFLRLSAMERPPTPDRQASILGVHRSQDDVKDQ